jgi:hypothetical protein
MVEQPSFWKKVLKWDKIQLVITSKESPLETAIANS